MGLLCALEVHTGPPARNPGAEPLPYPGAASFKEVLISAVLRGPGTVPKPSPALGNAASRPGAPGRGTRVFKGERSWREGQLSVRAPRAQATVPCGSLCFSQRLPALGSTSCLFPFRLSLTLFSPYIQTPQQDHRGPS